MAKGKHRMPTARQRELAQSMEDREAWRRVADFYGIPERFQIDPLAADDDPDTAAYL